MTNGSGMTSKQTAHYRKMYDAAEPLCKSQIYNELYNKLLNEGRLRRFIGVVQYCSIKGFDIKETIDFILKSFPSYIEKRELTVGVFKDMIQNYSDIACAWGYGSSGDEVSQIIVKNRAMELIERTTSMADIQAYVNIYGKEELSGGANGTVVNFNIGRKE